MNKENVKKLIEEIGKDKIIAATKYISSEKMEELYSLGITNFGENRTDSFLEKYEKLSHLNITWHFIGHLQRNKAEEIINKIDVLHSLDSIKLAKIIDEKRNRPLDVYIEIKMTSNEKKSGVKLESLSSFIEEIKKYPKINVIGFMTMTDVNSDDNEKRRIFKKIKELAFLYGYKCLSMGMSDDYKIALEEGSTSVRLGRILYSIEDYKDEYKSYFKEGKY